MRRFRFRDAYIFALIVILGAFAIAAAWPGNPDKYLPDFVPWPSGGGVSVGSFERTEFRLGLDLAGGVSVTLEVAGEAAAVRRGESLNAFLEREGVSRDVVLELNPALGELDREEDDQPLPAGITTIVLPLDVDDATLAEAVEESRRIIEERVSGFGVSEAEVTLVGDNADQRSDSRGGCGRRVGVGGLDGAVGVSRDRPDSALRAGAADAGGDQRRDRRCLDEIGSRVAGSVQIAVAAVFHPGGGRGRDRRERGALDSRDGLHGRREIRCS